MTSIINPPETPPDPTEPTDPTDLSEPTDLSVTADRAHPTAFVPPRERSVPIGPAAPIGPPLPPVFRHEWADDELSGLLVSHNRNEVLIAEICTPERVRDVEDHLAIIGPRMGVSRARARDYCYIGLMFRRMPTLHRQARDRGHLPFRHLASIAVGTVAVDDEHIGDVEKDLLDYLAPSKDGLALPGIRSFNREICRIVDEHDPLARPIDEDDPAEERAARESVVIETDTANGLGHLNATLDKDRMAEFQELLAAERNRRIDLEGKCTWADALMGMARGEANPRIVMNVYRDINGGRAYLDGAGWLSDFATEEWTRRCTHARLSGDSRVNGYVPSAAQQARVRGRDGFCRFPGCDVPARKCDIDHIQPYDHDNPGAGGPTDSRNLHCLCRRHHNLKTSRLWDVVKLADDTEIWSSRTTGDAHVSVPQGPLAGCGRQTFDEAITRTTATLHEHNTKRMQREAEQAEADRMAAESFVRAREARERRDRDFREANVRRRNRMHAAELRDYQDANADWFDAQAEGWPTTHRDPEPPKRRLPHPDIPF